MGSGGERSAATTEAQPRIGLLFLGRKRPGFDPEWGGAMSGRVRRATQDLNCYEPDVEIVDDSTLKQALRSCREHDVDAVVTLQTTMSDARLARTLCQEWPEPVVLWATPENPEGSMISSCSLVGIHNWASNLFHHQHGFEIVGGDPEDEATMAALRRSTRIVFAHRRLRRFRLGVIGGQAPGFYAMAPDANALHRTLGAQVQQFSLPQFLDELETIPEDEIATDVKRIERLGLPYRDAAPQDLQVASQLYLGLRGLCRTERLDAVALRCWPELPQKVGQWPYLGMSRLADEGIGIAMEGDGDGALAAAIGRLLGFGPCFLTDWLEHDDRTITFWHPGNIPLSMAPPLGRPGSPRLARHFNNKKPLVVESTLPPDQPVTIVRLWNVESAYLITAFEGTTVDVRRELMGSQAVVETTNARPPELFDELCHAGMPHHVAVFYGRHRKTLRSWARLSGLKIVE